jgi:PAS domain S-box-containing protein
MKLILVEPQIWALDSAITSVIEAQDMDQLLEITLQKVSQGLGARAGMILLLAENGNNKQVKVYNQGHLWAEQPHQLDQKTINKVVQAGAPLIREQVKDLDHILGVNLGWRPQSAAYIPLMVEDRVLGLLGLASPAPHFFQKRGLSWLSFWGKQLGLAIHKVQLEWKLKKAREQLATLSEITSILGHPLKLDDMLQLVLEKILEMVELESGGIYLLDDNSRKLKLVASRGLPGFLLEAVEQEYGQTGLKNQVLHSATPLVISDLSRAPQVDEMLRQSGYHSFVGVPIKSKKRVWGLISLLGKHERFSPPEVEILSTVGNGIATTIESNTLFNQLVYAKNEWEKTFDSITDMVAILDQDFTILRANLALAAKFHQHPRNIVGSKCYQLFHPGSGPPPDCPCVRTLRSGKPCTRERKMPHLGGTYLISTSPITNDWRKGTSIAYIARDITAHKELEHQLLQMQKMECIGNLAGGIAHDFNNLLEGILGYAAYIKHNLSADDPLYAEVEMIENIASKGTNLTRQLLDFARRGEVKLAPIRANDMVEEVTRLLSRTIKKNIRITKSLDQEPLVVKGDEGQIQQVILNICLNARDAMPEGGEIKISTQKVLLDEEITEINPWAEPGEYLRLSITDTGCGMDSETQEKIFDPFFTTKQNGKGTGLGLASVYGIIKNHRGHIQVKSQPGQGTTVEVYLPLLKDESKPLAKEAGTILIVDNEELVRRKAQTVLKNKGYKVLLADNGQAAVDILKKQGRDIDLVILDLVVPQVNGQQTYKLLKQIKADIRVLLSSGRTLSEHTKRALSCGSAGILQKPYQPTDLLRQVERALGK